MIYLVNLSEKDYIRKKNKWYVWFPLYFSFLVFLDFTESLPAASIYSFLFRSIHRLAKIKEWVDAHDPGAMVIPLSGSVEAKLLDMEEEERNKYCEEQKTQRSDQ